MDIRELIEQNRDEIIKIAARHGAYNIRLFGSVARGDAGLESDIDFLVEMGPNRSYFFPGGLIVDLEKLLGRKVQVVTVKALHRYIRDRILQEAVPL